MLHAAPSGSPMSCSASNVVTRSYGPPLKVCALATSKLTDPLRLRLDARLRAWSTESAW